MVYWIGSPFPVPHYLVGAGMRPSVLPAFLTITRIFEGGKTINWLFTDVKGLVSTGMGLLLDPVELALALQWRHGTNGPPASESEVRNAFAIVKRAQGPCFDDQGNPIPTAHGGPCLGGGASFFSNLSDLRLDDASMSAAVQSKLNQNETIFRSTFPSYDAWPADAQLGLHSLSWARGPSYPGSGKFGYPLFTAALQQPRPDFAHAAIESHLDETGNPGVGPRNDAQRVMFSNAQAALDQNLDPNALIYPRDLLGVAASRRDLRNQPGAPPVRVLPSPAPGAPSVARIAAGGTVVLFGAALVAGTLLIKAASGSRLPTTG